MYLVGYTASNISTNFQINIIIFAFSTFLFINYFSIAVTKQ